VLDWEGEWMGPGAPTSSSQLGTKVEICAGMQTILDQSPHLGLPALCLEGLTAPVTEQILEPGGESEGCKESWSEVQKTRVWVVSKPLSS